MMNVFRYELPIPGAFGDCIQYWDTIVGLCTVTRWRGRRVDDPILADTITLLVNQMLMRREHARRAA